jgi:hypothetical protein
MSPGEALVSGFRGHGASHHGGGGLLALAKLCVANPTELHWFPSGTDEGHLIPFAVRS